ncbi:MAG: YgiQ family radical SAM protein [Bacteroidales bacterium]
MIPLTSWLPTTREEILKRGWEELDIILFSGDAYVDHPSFGTAVIGRFLEKHGYKVAIVPQPNWRDDLRDFKKLGRPRLFFGVAAGNMDSMVNHYTAARRLRSDDAYSPGGQSGFRPDYPTIVYSNILKDLYPDTPLIIGGIEASLRRFTHYDYWQDSLKPSILFDSNADLLVYGMGEKAVLEIARSLEKGNPLTTLTTIPQTAFFTESSSQFPDAIMLPSLQECEKDDRTFARAFTRIETESNKISARILMEPYDKKVLVVNPPYPVTGEKEMDSFYDLPYTRMPHPRYNKRGPIPAYEMIRHSVNLHRGCFGGCTFCTISAHQGKFISSRSEKSIINEVEQVTNMPDFKGYISDLGGPSANMYKMQGINLEICGKCSRPSCIFPSRCKNLNTDHRPLISIYDKAVALKGIKKVFIGSGVRYDLFIDRPKDESSQNSYQEYFEKLVKRHVSGRLKVAPEHTSEKVLQVMRKPSFQLFHSLKQRFEEINRKSGLNQQLIPYFISSHPGCRLQDMAELAEETRKLGYKLEQVQDLTPTPLTLASVMYYTGLDPYTMKPIYVARTKKDKDEQKRFFFWYKPENREWIKSFHKRKTK